MELNFQGEVLTPMFLGGADPLGNPELRAPWFRALAGGARKAKTVTMGEKEVRKGF